MNQVIGRNTVTGTLSGMQLQGSPRNLEPFSLGNHVSSNSVVNNSILNGIASAQNNVEAAYYS